MNLSRFNLLLLAFAVSAAVLSAQTLYVPGGTSGIGNNTANGNVGIGTTTPTSAKLVVASPQSSATNTVVAEFTKDGGANSYGSTILRLSRTLGGESTDIELNSGGSAPFRYGTYADSIFVNNQNYSTGPYGSIQFVTNQAARLTIGGGTLAGNIGIGTTNPNSTLHTNGIVGITKASTNYIIDNTATLRLGRYDNGAGTAYGYIHAPYNESVTIWNHSTAGIAEFKNNRDSIFYGNVGIGTTNPGTYKLAVVGKIRAQEVVVDTGWSDYVFKPDYKLASLSEVEGAIKQNGHLPGIPSAQEVADHGISVGEMQAKLLAKMEEMTLYVIDLKKKNEALQSRVSELEHAQIQR